MHQHMSQPTRRETEKIQLLQHSRIFERRSISSATGPHAQTHSISQVCPPLGNVNNSQEYALKVPEVADRSCQPKSERKSLMLEYVNTKYPEDQWTHAYRRFCSRSYSRWGSRVCVTNNDGEAHITIATRNIQPTLKQKLKLSKKGAIEIRDNLSQTKLNVIIFTKALSVLSKLQEPGFESRLRQDFSRSGHISNLNIGTPVASLPGTWRYRVSAGNGRPGVSIL